MIDTIKKDLVSNMKKPNMVLLLYSLCTSTGFSTVFFYRLACFLNKLGPLGTQFAKLMWRWRESRTRCFISLKASISPGLSLPHPVGVVIGEGVTVGEGTTIFQNVTLGRASKDLARYPRIGRGVIIYAGAVVLGDVTIGDYAVVGANAVVTKNVPDRGVAVGIPARIVEKREH